ncbi:hypothetical protein [Rhodococcus sp. HNM0569]|uniref:hypothetical protein n=1 Tax=Rhodococcus sp. HNM0569 TaxID=2716340 RepID=UPI00146E9214|nr:hypothetical protein [Rhodococcus sp. HNM0569]NLU81628.1 hypothetical protein [Rhodococcus sp. HNM0569]
MSLQQAGDLIGDLWGWFTASRVASGAAVLAAGAAIQTFRRARRDSQSRSRPMVGAELRPVPYANGMAELVVRNYGPSVARDVCVTFEPPLGDANNMLSFIVRRYSDPIPTLMPGAELNNIWPHTEPGFPEQVTASISTKSNDRGWFGRRDHYREDFVLDMRVLKQGTSATSSTSPEGRLKQIAKALDAIADNSAKRT